MCCVLIVNTSPRRSNCHPFVAEAMILMSREWLIEAIRLFSSTVRDKQDQKLQSEMSEFVSGNRQW